jgi:type VI secretion system secreted protein Hcp
MRFITRFCRVALSAVLCLTLASPAYAATQAYLMIEGAKQGQFKGESMRKGGSQWIPILAVSHAVQSPRDIATGQASGKRQHTPIRITKEWGAASSQLDRARATNEVLRLVVIEFVHQGPQGKENVYQIIKLTNAQVASIERRQNRGGGAAKDTHELEEISFTFQKIEVTNENGKTAVADSWTEAR